MTNLTFTDALLGESQKYDTLRRGVTVAVFVTLLTMILQWLVIMVHFTSVGVIPPSEYSLKAKLAG